MVAATRTDARRGQRLATGAEFNAVDRRVVAHVTSSQGNFVRDEYGRHSLGQSCLMARRLVEAGVRCVTIDHSNWDTHDGNFATLKNSLLPVFDAGISTRFRRPS